MTFMRVVLVVVLALGGLVTAPQRSPGAPAARDIELVGAFIVGAPISGAALLDGFLYVTTSDRLSIYDVSNPLVPTLLGTAASPGAIYGELISTDGETLLLNDGLVRGRVDVWDVEDKTNPVLAETMLGISDEHVSCLLDCRWAYGSNGTIVDLQSFEVRDENWLDIVEGEKRVHRIDEFRHGFMASAPRGGPLQILDVRRPLRPRTIATAKIPREPPSSFLYSSWARGGRDRFVIATGEMGRCNDRWRGALTTFDTRGWRETGRVSVAGTYKYRGRANSSEDRCTSYYFSLRPGFANGGEALLPSGLEGLRLVSIDKTGAIEEVDSFTPPISDVWFTFWLDEEIFYAINRTGEIYILRYSA